MDMDVS